MRKVVVYTAVSMDYFIARPNGAVDWLEAKRYALEGEDYGYFSFIETVDTVVMGNNTFRQILEFDGPYPYPDQKNYVFTRSSGQTSEHAQFVSEDPVNFLKQLVASPGKDIWIVGGGQINSLLLRHHLVDRIVLSMMPEFLGEGIPLFPGKTVPQAFECKQATTYENGVVQLTFDRV